MNHSIWGEYLESPYQQSEIHMRFSNGETCPGDIERQTEVLFPSLFDCSLSFHVILESLMDL